MRRAPGIPAVVLTPAGAVAGPKVAQTRMFGAKVLEVRGDFDEALAAAQELGRRGTHVLVNSVNPYRRAGQKTAVFEIVEELGAAPDAFVIPYGGGGNTSAYAAGIGELGLSTPIFSVEAEHRPTTLASAIRIGDPVHAESVRASGATVVTVSDEEIVAAWLQLATVEGLFCEPSSAAGLAAIRRGAVAGERLVVTITGHGLKDTESADRYAPRARAGRGRPRRDRRRSTGMTVFRAPATSANIGAGFDTAAVAFDLWNELEVTDGSGVIGRGRGCERASRRRVQPRRARLRAARRPGRKALPLHEPDPARARARLVGGRDRARPRRGCTERERGGAARRRDHARAARRQPRRGAPRRAHAVVGRADRPDRRAAAARRRRRRPQGAHLDRELPQDAARNRAPRRGGRERGPGGAARCRRGERRRVALLRRAQRLAPRAVPPVRRRSPRSGPRRRPAAAARRCRDRGRP